MDRKFLLCVVLGLALTGCGKSQPPEEIVVAVNDYQVTVDQFEEGFAQSPFALREDKPAARKEYMDNLINQKLIIQDAVKKGLDKQKDFMSSVERFWEQSLLTVAVGTKTNELHGTPRVHDANIRQVYDQMVKDGVTQKSYEEMYPQIKWQQDRQVEAQLLQDWMARLRKDAMIQINSGYFKE